MLVLGKKHTFTDNERILLKKRFSNITYIDYFNDNVEDVLSNLKEKLLLNHPTLLVLNTKARVDDEIIKYLTNLRLENSSSKIEITSIENFMQEYLFKCYIPSDHKDLHYLEDIKPFTFWQNFQKRSMDYFGVFWLFLFSWPLIIYTKKKIRQESPGPVLFEQERVGKNNKTFTCKKFRSMHIKHEFFNHYTQENDPRIFAWGNIMRCRRYDELPQMINILKGEMHLIGPRAEWVELVRSYEKEIPYYNERHIIAPGITGWAQVNYPYGANAEDARQKLMYDLYYIKHWSVFLDLKIIYKTAMTVLHSKGL